MKGLFSAMEKECFGSHVGKLEVGPAGTMVDIIPVLLVFSVLKKINEVIGMKNICKRQNNYINE